MRLGGGLRVNQGLWTRRGMLPSALLTGVIGCYASWSCWLSLFCLRSYSSGVTVGVCWVNTENLFGHGDPPIGGRAGVCGRAGFV